jgi:hypothetical protein
MKARAATVLWVVLACWLLSACTQWRYDLGEPLDTLQIPPQNSTLGEVLASLGPPLRASATDNGFVLAWEHLHVREDSAGFSLGAVGADFLSADWGEMRIKGEFLLLTFDRQHLLTSATRSTWDNDGGGGQAIQPFFGFVSVVDSDDVTTAMPQHRWGKSLLTTVPGALNHPASLDNGQGGLEQRGTPNAAGE